VVIGRERRELEVRGVLYWACIASSGFSRKGFVVGAEKIEWRTCC